MRRPGQDGWTVFGLSAAVNIQSVVVKTGSQAVGIDGSHPTGSFQTGPWRPISTTGPIVLMEMDAYLRSGQSMSQFQFSGMNSFTSGGFIGGFNAQTDNTLQLQTGSLNTYTAPVIVRDTWQHWAVVFNFTTQKFDVVIDGTMVASNQPFLNAFNSFEVGFFDVFGAVGRDDFGYFDNYSVSTVVPEPQSIGLVGIGLLALLGVRTRLTKR